MMQLRRPSLADKEAILDMIAEFAAANSYMHGGMGSTWKRAKDFEDWLDMVEKQENAANLPAGSIHGMRSVWTRDLEYETCLEVLLREENAANLPAGWVPSIQFLSFDEDGLPLGFLALRLALNEKTFVEGGHIGYSIRPSKRRQGLAKEQLALGLKEAAKAGLDRVLITCDVDNEGSRRTILAAGGVYENTIDGSQRYWIDLEGRYEQSQTPGVEERGAEQGADY